MPIVFKKQEVEQYTIDKDGTKFHFVMTEPVRRAAEANVGMSGLFDYGKYIEYLFEQCMIGWENLQDEKGKPVRFTEHMRRMILETPGIFNDDDIVGFELWAMAQVKKNRSMTLMPENAQPITSTTTGHPEDVQDVKAPMSVKGKKRRAF